MDIGDGVADWVIHIDDFDDGLLNGWGLDRQRPDHAISIEVSSSGGEKQIISASTFRPDLVAAGFGNGRHAFSVDLSHWDLAGNTVTVRPLGIDDPAQVTSISTDLAASLTRKPWSDEYLKMLDDLAAPFVTPNDA
jgi:hypothetical protein